MLKNRNELIKLFAEKGYKYGAEIGVAQGLFSKYMMDTIPGLELLSVDPYIPANGISMRKRRLQYVRGKRRLARYLKNKMVIDTSMNAVADVGLETLDFVYIDADHGFNSVMCDIIEWSKRVRKGGIVSGHDYVKKRGFGVVDAVDMYAKHNNVEIMLTENDGYGGHSWYFFK